MGERTITVRMDDETYNAVKQWGEQEHQSLNRVITGLIEREWFRRRCAAHDAQMRQAAPAEGELAAEFTTAVNALGPDAWPPLRQQASR